MVGQRKRSGVVDGRTCMLVIWRGFLNDGDSGGKLLQRGAIVGRWDGHTLNLGGVGRMAAEHRSVVAADCGGRDERVRRRKRLVKQRVKRC